MSARNQHGQLQQIRSASIRRHELDVTVPLQRHVDVYRRIFAKTVSRRPRQAEGVPAVRVGDVDGTPYLMADGDVYRGALAAGAESIRCTVIKCADASDFLVRHVQCNGSFAGINPLLLRKVSDYVSAHGSEEEVSALSRICRGTVHQKFIMLDLDPGAAAILDELCEFLGTKLSQFVLPYYIPHHIARQRPDMQWELAEKVSGLVRVRSVTDARFAWPSYEEIKVITDSPRYRKEEESKVVTPDGERPPLKEVRRARQLIKNTRGVIVIPGTDAHPPYLINLKTKRAYRVENRKTVTVLRNADPEGAGAAMTYLLPREAGRWLGLSDGKRDDSDVKMTQFDAATNLAEFSERHRGARGVVFYRKV